MRSGRAVTTLVALACFSCGRTGQPGSYREAIAMTTDIVVKQPRDRTYPEGLSIARYHREPDRAVFAALASARPAPRPPDRPARMRIVLYGGSRMHLVLDYEPVTGSVRFMDEWLRVPEPLRRDLDAAFRRAARTPAMGPGPSEP